MFPKAILFDLDDTLISPHLHRTIFWKDAIEQVWIERRAPAPLPRGPGPASAAGPESLRRGAASAAREARFRGPGTGQGKGGPDAARLPGLATRDAADPS